MGVFEIGGLAEVTAIGTCPARFTASVTPNRASIPIRRGRSSAFARELQSTVIRVRLAHCRNSNVGVPEFTYQRPYWRERLGGKRRRRTRCELCWGNGRSPTHLPGLRCVGLSGRLSATVVPPPEPRLQILCRRTATPIPQIRYPLCREVPRGIQRRSAQSSFFNA